MTENSEQHQFGWVLLQYDKLLKEHAEIKVNYDKVSTENYSRKLQISKKDQLIGTLKKQCSSKDIEIATLTQRCSSKDNEIATLALQLTSIRFKYIVAMLGCSLLLLLGIAPYVGWDMVIIALGSRVLSWDSDASSLPDTHAQESVNTCAAYPAIIHSPDAPQDTWMGISFFGTLGGIVLGVLSSVLFMQAYKVPGIRTEENGIRDRENPLPAQVPDPIQEPDDMSDTAAEQEGGSTSDIPDSLVNEPHPIEVPTVSQDSSVHHSSFFKHLSLMRSPCTLLVQMEIRTVYKHPTLSKSQ
jgi:hypothetical protein